MENELKQKIFKNNQELLEDISSRSFSQKKSPHSFKKHCFRRETKPDTDKDRCVYKLDTYKLKARKHRKKIFLSRLSLQQVKDIRKKWK